LSSKSFPFDLACGGNCGYADRDNFVDPICPVLAKVNLRTNVMGAQGDKLLKASVVLFEAIAAKNKEDPR